MLGGRHHACLSVDNPRMAASTTHAPVDAIRSALANFVDHSHHVYEQCVKCMAI